jgi:putative aminopeptidase FrvX
MSAGERIAGWLEALVAVPGLSGYEDRVRRRVAGELAALGIASRSDRLGNLVATVPGGLEGPPVMLFAHMDQLGFVVRRVLPDGLLQVERVGGVPERALAAQEVLIALGEGRDLPGVIGNKSHHATGPEEKYRVLPYREITIDAGFGSAEEARIAGVEVGAPVVYAPRFVRLAGGRVAGAAIDDRAGCAVLLEVARALEAGAPAPPVHLVFSVQEEFNLRGVVPAAQALAPEVAIQLDLVLATDTPEMADRGEVRLGGGPAMSLYSFHGRGTLNGLIPHPALVGLFEGAASAAGLRLQRSAHVGALTETAYVQLLHEGVACVDLGFPVRYSHSAREVCDLGDLEGLAALVLAGLERMGPGFGLGRDAWT